ncbi:conserved hypothetical protein [Theileria equi strain WA]|uniref:Signal peptide-containing protein n=1 Tax=Theileria equi strain WA TaxID=1537102 RepID=L1LD09_THEEQ|nr:conserved hypothetical protein [Theileria equi strain WA]EKX73063.1 conserved hypothetical protein [Theileria equi strain WA]|eukprot:XP_004832515.1 conserved hypothetical protein [Theileria equi strain WA]
MEFQLHLLVIIFLVQTLSNFVVHIVRRVVEQLDKLFGGNKTGEEGAAVPQTGNALMDAVIKGNVHLSNGLKFLLKSSIFVLDYLLPYLILSRFSSFTSANYERQLVSYSPFTVVECKFPHVPFLHGPLPAHGPEDAHKEYSGDAETIEEYKKLTEDAAEKSGGGLFGAIKRRIKSYSSKNPRDLNGFNRYLAFAFSKRAINGLYLAAHALVSPYNHAEFAEGLLKKKH